MERKFFDNVFVGRYWVEGMKLMWKRVLGLFVGMFIA